MLKLIKKKTEYNNNQLEQKVYYLEKKVDKILEKLEAILFLLNNS